MSCDVEVFDAVALLENRSRRRAHLGGRSVEVSTQAIFARRQFEHGDCLSQRTLRLRHVTQLRSFGVGFGVGFGPEDGVFVEVGELALFSASKAETVTSGRCDMLHPVALGLYFWPASRRLLLAHVVYAVLQATEYSSYTLISILQCEAGEYT